MRIVMVANQFPKFSETFIVHKFLALLRRGWDVHVACRQSEPAQWALFPALASTPGVDRRVHLTTDLEGTLGSIEPHLVHFEFGVLAVGRTAVKDRLGCKVVVSFRGSDLFAMAIDAPGYYAPVFEAADVLHFLGRELWRQARRRGCPSSKPHVFIAPAIDAGFVSQPARTHVERAGSAGRPLRVLSVGRLTWTKGYEFGLQAVRLLVDRGVRCDYRIVGEGEARRALTFDIHDLRLESVARLLGVRSRDEVRGSMAWADVFVHPARYEGFCNVVLEAQAMGLPVVCSDGGGLVENVRHARTGLIVPRRDPAALAEAVMRFTDPDLRRQYGRAGRARIRRRFRADDQVERFEALYRRLLGGAVRGVADEQPRSSADVAAVPSPGGRTAVACRERFARPTPDLGPQVLERVRSASAAKELARVDLVERIRRRVAEVLPPVAHVCVVSRGDDDLLRHAGRRCSHFPAAADGGYAGYHPTDCREAIAAVDAARACGAEFLLFPRTAFWWLEHYSRLARYLAERCQPVVTNECCVIFTLTTQAAPVAHDGIAEPTRLGA